MEKIQLHLPQISCVSTHRTVGCHPVHAATPLLEDNVQHNRALLLFHMLKVYEPELLTLFISDIGKDRSLIKHYRAITGKPRPIAGVWRLLFHDPREIQKSGEH